jgi:hypothetical protein
MGTHYRFIYNPIAVFIHPYMRPLLYPHPGSMLYPTSKFLPIYLLESTAIYLRVIRPFNRPTYAHMHMHLHLHPSSPRPPYAVSPSLPLPPENKNNPSTYVRAPTTAQPTTA